MNKPKRWDIETLSRTEDVDEVVIADEHDAFVVDLARRVLPYLEHDDECQLHGRYVGCTCEVDDIAEELNRLINGSNGSEQIAKGGE